VDHKGERKRKSKSAAKGRKMLTRGVSPTRKKHLGPFEREEGKREKRRNKKKENQKQEGKIAKNEFCSQREKSKEIGKQMGYWGRAGEKSDQKKPARTTNGGKRGDRSWQHLGLREKGERGRA